ncbi:MAG TPA: glycogen/starch/alpha-glucan phosphorylase [Selenomonadales bacterium]|nr:glycogen/starch/alpha-glucan phosphorylase [Selenomonadales bacterium]
MELSKEAFKEEFLDKIVSLHGKELEDTSDLERYQALSAVVRDFIGKKWAESRRRRELGEQKQVYYLSIEFLLGRMLGMYLTNMGLRDLCADALADLGVCLEAVEEAEEDPGLGNGGLGRLAACYLDSMAAEQLPGHGCCLRYRFGFFEQRLVDGYQREYPDDWLAEGFDWEYRRPDEAVVVRFGGEVEAVRNGRLHYLHRNYDAVQAVPYDIPILGYKNDTVNQLRIWGAEPVRDRFDCNAQGRNDCMRAVECHNEVGLITSVLYPDDSIHEGKVLRLKQQYFLVSASLQSILNDCRRRDIPLTRLPDHVAVHINDTHPTLAIPELMRLLMDEEGMGWDEAWTVTTRTISYTNHTVLPEALEKWPVDILAPLLPRVFIIINEINERFCHQLWDRYPGDWDKIRSLAVIADGNIHMAHLAIVGSYSVNGVADIHTEILKTRVMEGFYRLFPHKFNSKTNGVTHRRWLLYVNPSLAALLDETAGPGWVTYPCDMLKLQKYKDDPAFQEQLAAVKRENKEKLARHIRDFYGVAVDPDSLFDSHIKRIHGYKRQTMNALHILYLYNRLKDDPSMSIVPRTFIFGGKAAPGYQQAKRTIKLINTLAELINNDKTIRDQIKVVFLENYNVTAAELIIPGSDVSVQIPTASREACGTGNMKFMMNGAVTIGTLDGANIEIRNAVGDDNIIAFGLTAEEVLDYYQHGGYNAWEIYNADPRVRLVLDQLVSGFLPADRDEFRPLYDAFLHHNDEYFVLKDFGPFVEAQKRLESAYRDQRRWLSMCAVNIAHSGKFAGDRTFTGYAMDIWRMNPAHPVRCYCPSDESLARLEDGCGYSEPRREKSAAILL